MSIIDTQILLILRIGICSPLNISLNLEPICFHSTDIKQELVNVYESNDKQLSFKFFNLFNHTVVFCLGLRYKKQIIKKGYSFLLSIPKDRYILGN